MKVLPENVLRATPTDCGREAACGKCDVCKYLEFIEHAQSVAPPESTIHRNYEIEQYISRTYPAH